MTIDAALREAAAVLAEAGVDAPRLTAQVLLAHTLRRDRSWLFAHGPDPVDETARLHFGRHVHERLQGRPTQYITGVQEFYGRDFHVNPQVLIPRPETEHVIEHALPLVGQTVVDVGCGSGAIGVTLALEARRPVILTDLDAGALAVARGNALRLGADVRCVLGDLTLAFAPASVDLLVSNPPYIAESEELPREVKRYEPHLALFGGLDGNAVYERLVADAARVVKPGGWVVLELGWRSAAAVRAFAERDFADHVVHQDLAGLDRVFVARRR